MHLSYTYIYKVGAQEICDIFEWRYQSNNWQLYLVTKCTSQHPVQHLHRCGAPIA